MSRTETYQIGDHYYNALNLQIIWIAAKDKVDTAEIARRLGLGTVTVRQNYKKLLAKWGMPDAVHYHAVEAFQKFLDVYGDKVKEIKERAKIKTPTLGDQGLEQLNLFEQR